MTLTPEPFTAEEIAVADTLTYERVSADGKLLREDGDPATDREVAAFTWLKPGASPKIESASPTRAVTIDIATGEWLTKEVITIEEGARIAASVLPGIHPDQITKFYDDWLESARRVVNEKSLAAGGWCAPTSDVYLIAGGSPDCLIPGAAASRGGVDFEKLSQYARAERTPLPPAPEGAGPGHWEFAVVDDEDGEIYAGGTSWNPEPFLHPEDAAAAWAGCDVLRRWVPDPTDWVRHE